MDPQHLVQATLEQVSFPKTTGRVTALLDDPDSDTDAIASALSLDPALAARVLKVANSALYLRGSPADSVGKAVTRLGRRLLRDLVLGSGAIQAFEDIDIEAAAIDDFWHHSIYCGVLAVEIARRSHPELADVAFTAGLLHDIGQLVLFIREPQAMRKVLLEVAESGDELATNDAELEVLGVSHEDVGEALGEEWEFPSNLRECMAHHHNPSDASEHPVLVAVVHIANSCAVLMEAGNDGLDDAPPIDSTAWQTAGIDASDVPDLIGRARDRYEAMRAALLS